VRMRVCVHACVRVRHGAGRLLAHACALFWEHSSSISPGALRPSLASQNRSMPAVYLQPDQQSNMDVIQKATHCERSQQGASWCVHWLSVWNVACAAEVLSLLGRIYAVAHEIRSGSPHITWLLQVLETCYKLCWRARTPTLHSVLIQVSCSRFLATPAYSGDSWPLAENYGFVCWCSLGAAQVQACQMQGLWSVEPCCPAQAGRISLNSPSSTTLCFCLWLLLL